MFNKKLFIGIIIITLVMIFIAGCSTIIPDTSLELERNKPVSLPQQALENQQATAHIPDHAQANLPFTEGGGSDWTSEIRIEDYQGKEAMEIGDMVYSTINGGMVTVYNLTDHDLRIDFSKQLSGGGSSGSTGPVYAYSNELYGWVGGQILSSVEPYSDEYGSGWAIKFVYP